MIMRFYKRYCQWVEKITLNFSEETTAFVKFMIPATVLFFLVITFYTDDNLLGWISAKFQIKSQEAQIEYYQQEIDKMNKKLNLLSNDRDTLEKFAREQFHFASPGDDVYILE